jgi:hypothetical protein
MGRRNAWGWNKRKETEINQYWITEPSKVDEECLPSYAHHQKLMGFIRLFIVYAERMKNNS